MKSSGFAGMNRFSRFDLDELDIIRWTLEDYKPKYDNEAHKEYNERMRERITKLVGEIWEVWWDKNQKAKGTFPEHPCPDCKNPSVRCNCSSSCNHIIHPAVSHYCNHCEKYFLLEDVKQEDVREDYADKHGRLGAGCEHGIGN